MYLKNLTIKRKYGNVLTCAVKDVKAIVELKESFEKSLPKIREKLQNMDSGCPHIHHFKLREMDDCCDELAYTKLPKLGHPLPCSVGMCHSKLQILQATSVHYPILRQMLYGVYMARKYHNTITIVDNALFDSNFEELCKLIDVKDYEELLGETLEQEDSMHCDEPNFSSEGLPYIERDLEIKHALLFKEYRDKLHDDPEYPCCSCKRLLARSSVTQLTFDAKNSILINAYG